MAVEDLYSVQSPSNLSEYDMKKKQHNNIHEQQQTATATNEHTVEDLYKPRVILAHMTIE